MHGNGQQVGAGLGYVMSLLGDLQQNLLGFRNEAEHVGQGEGSTVTLLQYVASSGDFMGIATVLTAKRRVSTGFGTFAEEFEIAESLLTTEMARKIHSVEHEGTRYKIGEKREPQGNQRVWRLRIEPVENT